MRIAREVLAGPGMGRYYRAMDASTDAPPPGQGAPSEAAATSFDAILTPHRSLGPLGFAVLIGIVATANIGLGIAFMLKGAWPIFGFCGLDVLLFYVMFQLNYRSARMFERIRLWPNELVVERHDVRGTMRSWSFQPYWLRVAIDDPPHPDSQLVLRSHGRAIAIGSFLTAAERLDLALALQRALDSQRARATS